MSGSRSKFDQSLRVAITATLIFVLLVLMYHEVSNDSNLTLASEEPGDFQHSAQTFGPTSNAELDERRALITFEESFKVRDDPAPPASSELRIRQFTQRIGGIVVEKVQCSKDICEISVATDSRYSTNARDAAVRKIMGKDFEREMQSIGLDGPIERRVDVKGGGNVRIVQYITM